MEASVCGAPGCTRSGREEPAEGSSYLSDHVGGGGGAPELLKGLVVTLPCECAGAPGSHQERAGAAEEHNKGHSEDSGLSFHPVSTFNSQIATSSQQGFREATSLQLRTGTPAHAH